jgi:hypothetical protein
MELEGDTTKIARLLREGGGSHVLTSLTDGSLMKVVQVGPPAGESVTFVHPHKYQP